MRPKLWHHITTVVAALILLGVTVFAVIRYGSVPDQIPTHFNVAGLADAYGSKSRIIVLLVLGWVSLIMMTVLSFFPNTWNVPKRTPRALSAAADMVTVMRLVVTLMFAWITICSVLCRGLGAWFLPAVLAGVFAPLVYLLVVSARE